MTLRSAAFLCAALLAACAPAGAPEVAERRAMYTGDLPPMRVFPAARATAPARSNAAIAEDFLDLTFQLESGRALPVFTRFEGPITVRATGDLPPSLSPDLDRLITRLRREAGLDIRRVDAGRRASITVEAVPRAELQRAVPQAACFVVPRLQSWDEFRRERRGARVDWTTLRARDRMAVFIPADVSPQEVRDCLHEEVAQALGPLNDLYRLTDSVFNDDNFHTVLTGFDMLILRATYAPELHSGMSRAQVARALPGVLTRLNPNGRSGGREARGPTPRAWIDAIETALGPSTSEPRRRAAAREAVEIARDRGWRDNRLAFSLFALGRLSLGAEPETALAAFLQAGGLYARTPQTEVHEAHVAMQLAAFALSSGQATAAIDIVDANTDAVARAENAALLASLLMIKVEALELIGRTAEARALRREALGWARYGFGPDAEVRARIGEITALNPRNRRRPS
ncbi:DUF2927 domain-containing protein [Tranquillimonas alkanivorans]|uniref:DUF2927 domain-containing protein n=1 Tax=Tranquillimonas alkanivorans TaxID=441119 RepID=A0A1I5MN12_9RHOB|nr:DUF2927 domain-containing protein [Tranquillimonas alkanivorans]SFP10346.1 Protein of unknown function [Tranquillimonas alkanivorans]